jgi:hypothetical protein
VDPINSALYGYVTAGDTGTSIAYIIPAHQAFHEIEQQMRAKVNFPSLKSLVDRSGTWSNDGISRDSLEITNP